MKSWKTTLIAIISIVVAVLTKALVPMLDADVSTVADWQSVVAVAIGSIGLIFAKDHSNPESGEEERNQVYPSEG